MAKTKTDSLLDQVDEEGNPLAQQNGEDKEGPTTKKKITRKKRSSEERISYFVDIIGKLPAEVQIGIYNSLQTGIKAQIQAKADEAKAESDRLAALLANM